MAISEGRIQEEKEVQEIKNKTPEFKKTKAYECFNLLAKVINFESTVRRQNIIMNIELNICY
jgi:hypothetical protein